MVTAPDAVARELGAYRRAGAEAASLSTTVRLANRETRLRRRRERLTGQVHSAVVR
ncbi:hypothetical protein [Solicola gregarius]|uniref:Uncharacterized protein n=1 Tax=Solicola gregarius TaxID=2908642 RepID=A0AA46TJY2_9ACTN|nr:hypothetical protein [Solicola gregarius]UYM06729.1 hypothetical protein L0C25_06565 [Solicola gregarius]